MSYKYKFIGLYILAICSFSLLVNKFFSLFPIKHIKIKNDFVHIHPQDLQKILSHEDLGNFFIVNVAKIKTVIRHNTDWVDSIVVKKVWPDNIEIYLTEKKTLGIFNNQVIFIGSQFKTVQFKLLNI